MTVVPSASRAAAISFRTLFFAPPTDTSPTSRFPPATRSVVHSQSNSLARQRRTCRAVPLPHGCSLTRIYTRTGDDGTTGLSDFLPACPRTIPRLIAYATATKRTRASGVALALGPRPEEIVDVLRQVQNDLFRRRRGSLDAGRSGPQVPAAARDRGLHRTPRRMVRQFSTSASNRCTLVHPSAGRHPPLGALLHSSRTIVRRAERSAWAAVEASPDDTSVLPAKYLNRPVGPVVSSSSRRANPAETSLWKPGAGRSLTPAHATGGPTASLFLFPHRGPRPRGTSPATTVPGAPRTPPTR
ncbi:ATP:cob(I)alamin adenosyltransferase [Rhodococcus hoagii]|nr:ATP:cob(I)alamin adenosyltransferase [Prescottella equi]